ncbi:MAG TPA: RDD family protein, partial [Gammaproteobacteria bacterium]|nr:RDD family protein [Gammaproteobacteria bacterium]
MNRAAPGYAGFWRRTGAWLLDLVLAWSTFVCALLVWSGVTGHAEPWDAPATPAVISSFALGFFILGRYLDAWLQGTPGKHLMGCRILDASSGRNMHLRQSLWR